MSISNGSMPVTESLIAAAPQAPGVFALWAGGGIVYYGRAATIRIALDEPLPGRLLAGGRVSGCSWEGATDPEQLQRELMLEYLAAHQRVPLWTDPQRLPP